MAEPITSPIHAEDALAAAHLGMAKDRLRDSKHPNAEQMAETLRQFIRDLSEYREVA